MSLDRTKGRLRDLVGASGSCDVRFFFGTAFFLIVIFKSLMKLMSCIECGNLKYNGLEDSRWHTFTHKDGRSPYNGTRSLLLTSEDLAAFTHCNDVSTYFSFENISAQTAIIKKPLKSNSSLVMSCLSSPIWIGVLLIVLLERTTQLNCSR